MSRNPYIVPRAAANYKQALRKIMDHQLGNVACDSGCTNANFPENGAVGKRVAYSGKFAFVPGIVSPVCQLRMSA